MELKNEIRVRRRGEWVCRGVPLAEGVLQEGGKLRLRDEGGSELPLAVEELGCWPDGSVKLGAAVGR